jgi:hypothetical protein
MRILGILAAALLAASASASAADRPCTKADAAAASKAIDRVVGWQQLHKVWQDWHHCDSGEAADVFTDAVLRLAVDWKSPESLASAMHDDPGYRAFVLAHLKGAGKDDRDAVYSRAKASCPSGQAAFCGEIAQAVSSDAAPKPKAPADETLDRTPLGRIPDARKK